MEKSNDLEKKKLQTLVAQLKSAMEAGKVKQVDSLTVQLDDLLFYLQEC